MKIDIKAGVKFHNKFEVEVKNVVSGEIEQRAEGYNIVLDQYFNYLVKNTSSIRIAKHINFGDGSGTISATRTTLFNQLGYKDITEVEHIYAQPPLINSRKIKIVIPTTEQIGKTITEVGLSEGWDNKLITHALLKDSEGNQISIGPKTDLQEITIYATVYADISLPDGVKLTYLATGNELLQTLFGASHYVGIDSNIYKSLAYDAAGGNYDTGLGINLSSSKVATDDQSTRYNDVGLGALGAGFSVLDSVNKKVSTLRLRFESANGNGKIWAIAISANAGSYINSSNKRGFLRMTLPNSIFSGHHFEAKAIGIGNGTQTKFLLPWSDINTSKEYKFYKDGVLLVEGTDYTLANAESETSITFGTAPATDLAITGDWWVDYIPKDTDHILDITFSIVYGEGV